MNNIKKYQFIIIFLFSITIKAQSLAVLDIAPINFNTDSSLKISNYIRNIISSSMNISIMDINEISTILNQDNINNRWCADDWCAKEIGSLIKKDRVFISSISKKGNELDLYGMIYDVKNDTIINEYKYLFYEENNYLLTEIEIMVYMLLEKELKIDLIIQHEYIHKRSQALLGITEKKYKKNALIRSIVYPGLGHKYLKKKLLSNIIITTQSLLISNTINNYFKYVKSSNEYKDLKNSYNKSDNVDEIEILRNQINQKHNSLKSFINRRKTFTNIFLSFWVLNIIHARMVSPSTTEILDEIANTYSTYPEIEKIYEKKID